MSVFEFLAFRHSNSSHSLKNSENGARWPQDLGAGCVRMVSVGVPGSLLSVRSGQPFAQTQTAWMWRLIIY